MTHAWHQADNAVYGMSRQCASIQCTREVTDPDAARHLRGFPPVGPLGRANRWLTLLGSHVRRVGTHALRLLYRSMFWRSEGCPGPLANARGLARPRARLRARQIE